MTHACVRNRYNWQDVIGFIDWDKFLECSGNEPSDFSYYSYYSAYSGAVFSERRLVLGAHALASQCCLCPCRCPCLCPCAARALSNIKRVTCG